MIKLDEKGGAWTSEEPFSDDPNLRVDAVIFE